jgi:ATP-dependent helicase/nuclease subunit A
VTPRVRVELDDRAARERIHNSLHESLLVEASAGTGKTTELVARIVRVLETGAGRIENIVAVTFTHKAAGELKIRLRQELDRARHAAIADPERGNLEDALERLEEASIGTIHSFCAQILRERPVEAVVDPAFQELTEGQARGIYANVFRTWFQEKLNETSPALRRALARIAAAADSWNTGSAIEQLSNAGWSLVAWRDFPTHWRRPQFDREHFIDELVEIMQQLADMSTRARRSNDVLARNLRPVRDVTTAISRTESARARDYDTAEALMIKLFRDMKRHTQKGSGIFGDGITREEVVQKRDALMHSLKLFQDAASADLAAGLRVEMWDLVESYGQQKRRAGKLDFVDLLILARDLVREKPDVRKYLQDRFSHIFVDEFQDTDPLQAELLLLLAADNPRDDAWLEATPKPGKLFLVGDPKQSIYKFRRADVVLYQEIKRVLEARGVGIVNLTNSHRALRPIQECVNATFLTEMVEDHDAGQTRYSPLEGGAEPILGQPSIIALPAPAPYGRNNRVAKYAVEACQPGVVAGFIEWLLRKSDWRVRNEGDLVPITERHICVLFRRFTQYGSDITREYVKALEAREIPHLLVGSKSFHVREEVQMLRAALAAVEWPDDELSVYATLRGSLFAIPDNLLLRWRCEVGHLHPFGAFADASTERTGLETCSSGLQFLAELHRLRNRQPIVATVNQLLEHTRAHAGFVLRPSGHQVLANVSRVCDLARAFEAEGGISFRGFVEQLEAEAERSESSEAPVLEEGAEGVRLMTVHAAKGLEFPVVILADMTAKLAPGEPDRHIDSNERRCAMRLLGCTPWELHDHRDQEERRERAEGLRVAYVAATRARDLLVVPAVGDEEVDGWVAPLNKAIYPPPANCRSSRRAPGCPNFGDCSVPERPFMFVDDPSVKPGLHAPQSGPHEVVWWDPRTLRLAVETDVGLRQQDILAETGSNDSQERYKSWLARREETTRLGERKQFDIFTPSEAIDSPPGAETEVHVILPSRDLPTRPVPSRYREGAVSGPRFGTLVHTIIRDVPFNADPGVIERLARSHGRMLVATDDEVAAAVDAVVNALAHPLVVRAARAERCYRELPVALRMADGRMLEGMIDLAFVENGGWTMLDFKTDADLSAKREHYMRQLRWYALALGRLTGEPVTANLMLL